MYYVYHLLDPRTNAVFYVGKGCRDRVDSHERDARAGVEHPKCDVIRDIWSAGGAVLKRRVKSFKEERDAYAFEASEVERIGLENLTNLVPGGGGIRRRTEVDLMPIDSARRMLNYIAQVAHTFASGKKYNQPWQMVIEKMVPVTVKGIVEKYGKDFVRNELAKYRVEADFKY